MFGSSGWKKEKNQWSWDVPKECRFNPDIYNGSIIDSRDGHVYKTVKIGVQEWMAENLNYYDATLDGRSWCYGAENSENTPNCAVTGRLYTWTAAINMPEEECGCGYDCTTLGTGNVQGVCPDGWHLPTQSEWNTLFNAVGGSSGAGTKLKSQTSWCNNRNGTDAVGFSALPAGYYAVFWSATEHNSYYAYYTDLDYDLDGGARLDNRYKLYGYSVRCVKD